MLPNFLVIGATKAGTTSLHAYLGNHPEIFMHPRKELRFFSAEHRWDNGTDWYRQQFRDAGSAKAVGETSNSYSRYPVYAGVPERIHRLLPAVRLIYLVRNPLQRIESHYRHRLATGREWRKPDDAIREDPSYLSASRYAFQLDRYLRYFPRRQILVVRSEDLMSDHGRTLQRIYEFLGVDAAWVGRPLGLNVTAPRPVTPWLVRQISRFPVLKPVRKAAAKLFRRRPFRGFLAEAASPSFQLEERSYRQLVETLEDDVRRLEAILDDGFSGWDLRASVRMD